MTPIRPEFNKDGIVRVFARMKWEYELLIQPDMEEHWRRFWKRPWPLDHPYWNLFTEVCRITGGAYFVGHIFGALFFTQVVTIGLLIWRW
mgnify:CR=1 FL=1